MKKIENYVDGTITFYKRKQKIYTKLSELSLLCGADVGFLVYSNSGITYTFGSPSFKIIAKRFLNGEGSSSTSLLQQSNIDVQHKEKMEELCKVYNSILEKSDAEKHKGMVMAKAEAETLPVEKDTWWRVDPTTIKDMEVLKQLLEKCEDLYEKLHEEVVSKNQIENAP
ncbi:PREDICTED: agamous-like MADS-box protein AGL61 [Camelina sativa]|uniref:Agamous-like MADS-box protein AGL61 n=1 Tax=Camelina sativa TaxID=90675 RepID=A0ABM0YJ80_CAMSA|nr:PREDICTED: agamous-like MADS-box protein AGL61 [Camelina sativa]